MQKTETWHRSVSRVTMVCLESADGNLKKMTTMVRYCRALELIDQTSLGLGTLLQALPFPGVSRDRMGRVMVVGMMHIVITSAVVKAAPGMYILLSYHLVST